MTVSGCTDRHSVETTTDKNYSQTKCLKSCTNMYLQKAHINGYLERRSLIPKHAVHISECEHTWARGSHFQSLQTSDGRETPA